MMAEYIKSEGYTQTRSLYAGHFLDNVVKPIYSIIVKVNLVCDESANRFVFLSLTFVQFYIIEHEVLQGSCRETKLR